MEREVLGGKKWNALKLERFQKDFFLWRIWSCKRDDDGWISLLLNLLQFLKRTYPVLHMQEQASLTIIVRPWIFEPCFRRNFSPRVVWPLVAFISSFWFVFYEKKIWIGRRWKLFLVLIFNHKHKASITIICVALYNQDLWFGLVTWNIRFDS